VITSSPNKFSVWFNENYTGAYRQISAEDVKDLTDLIFRHGYYSGSMDGETIRAVLQYEQLWEHRSVQQDKEQESQCCKICRQPLHPEPENKAGRHREYCYSCEPYRNKDRQSNLRRRRKELVTTKICHCPMK
jgi:hypothetical protein